jgi:hypothetical protein
MNLITITLQKHENGSVLGFKNGNCCASWPSFHSSKPDYRHKHVMLNCHRYKIQWNKTIATGIHEIKGTP